MKGLRPRRDAEKKMSSRGAARAARRALVLLPPPSASLVRDPGPVVRADTTLLELTRTLGRHKLIISSVREEDGEYFVRVTGRRGSSCGLSKSLAGAFAEAIEEYLSTLTRFSLAPPNLVPDGDHAHPDAARGAALLGLRS